ncbi:hypothetical protein SEA_JUMBO_16 [Gordonia phage Jumbo]|uniref:Uncharacterized protein n=1 Tax=Gordonia phage Jumbo TaxID=1887650 RepID=A0A1B3B0L2_9CAUD|nr:hypothetical protein BIZ69_gp016 [Gordonia phage Jumbo]AOE44529.1 hypothetical protein SEA_JUMBO_16 [Gordonia phage Jumbo]
MIDANTLCFPNNVVDFLAIALEGIDPDSRIKKRPIADTDDTQTIAVFPVAWSPNNDSMEMQGRRNEPTLQRYVIMAQSFIADMDEERGIRAHSLLAARVRHTLYRGEAVALNLPTLKVTFEDTAGSVEERVARWGITGQDYMNNQVPSTGKNLFLSTTEIFVETEFV